MDDIRKCKVVVIGAGHSGLSASIIKSLTDGFDVGGYLGDPIYPIKITTSGCIEQRGHSQTRNREHGWYRDAFKSCKPKY